MYKIKHLYIHQMHMPREQAPIFQRPHDLLKFITYTIECITQKGSKENSRRTKFHAKGKALIPFSSYLKRIHSFMFCSNTCFIVALVLLDRAQEANPVYQISSLNIHKLFMIAILVAAKLTDDFTYGQKYYAKVAGMEVQQLNNLEFQFCSLLSFDTFVSKETFDSYVQKLSNFCENNINADSELPESKNSQHPLTSSSESELQNVKKSDKINYRQMFKTEN